MTTENSTQTEPHSPHEDKNVDLVKAVKGGDWRTVDELLQRELNDEQRQWAVSEGLDTARQQEIIQYILPHCPQFLLPSVLEKAVRRNYWRLAGRVLQLDRDSCVSMETKHWAVEQACTHADQYDIVQHVLSNCELHFLQIGRCQSELVRRGFWQAFCRSCTNSKGWLMVGVSLRWVVAEAVERAGDEDLTEVLILYSQAQEMSSRRDDQDTVLRVFLLKEAVDRGLWRGVAELTSKILDRYHCCTAERERSLKEYYRSTFRQAIQNASDETFSYICSKYKRIDTEGIIGLVNEAVRRSLWLNVLEVWSNNLSDELRQTVVLKAIKSADDYCLRRILIESRKMNTDLNLVLECVVRRGLWDVLDSVLKEPSFAQASQIRAAIQEGIQEADNASLIQFILPHCNDEGLLERAFSELVNRRLWGTVVEFLSTKISDEQRAWAVEEAVKYAKCYFLRQILPQCAENQTDFALHVSIERGLWDAVKMLLQCRDKPVENIQVLEKAIRFAQDHELAGIIHYIQLHDDQIESVLKDLVNSGLWQGLGQVLKLGVCGALVQQVAWAIEEDSRRADINSLEIILPFCPEDQLVAVFKQLLIRNLPAAFNISRYLEHQVPEPDQHPQFLYRCFSYWFIASLLLDAASISDKTFEGRLNETSCENILKWVLSQDTVAEKERSKHGIRFKEAIPKRSKLHDFATTVYHTSRKYGVRFACTRAAFVKLFCDYIKHKLGYAFSVSHCSCRDIISVIDVCQTSNSACQSMALRKLVHNWDLLDKLCIACVWEEDRRWALQTAVEQRKWDVVRHLGDHTLYDDQRSLITETALKEKQWAVLMVLADHGMTDDQLRRVHRQVAKHADWDIVLQLFERGANLHQVREELQTAIPSRLRPPVKKLNDDDDGKSAAEYEKRLKDYTEKENAYKQRLKQLQELENHLGREASSFTTAVENCNWAAVLYRLYNGASRQQIKMTLHAAVEKEEQHVLVTLVRLGLDVAERDWLFQEAIRRRLWGVGRALLERPVSRELPGNATRWETLQHLMEEGQWILVARVMEYDMSVDVSDDVRRQVMQQALDRREGSVVAHIVSVMEGRVTVEERDMLFRQSLSTNMWQAVKRLVEEKDETGVVHRDETMFAAIEQKRWDIVEHCVKHGADINKPDATGLTMLQRAVQHRGENVQELLYQGADQSATDREGYSVLHNAVKHPIRNFLNHTEYVPQHRLEDTIRNLIDRQDTKAVESLIMFHGDTNQPNPQGETPLYNFIRYYLGAPIETAILWGRDVGRNTTYKGKNSLHQLCWDGRWDALRYVVARGGNPLAVTDDGESLLLFAVSHRRQVQQRLVAECIKLGISTHQPRVTDDCYLRDTLTDRSTESKSDRYSPFQRAASGQNPAAILQMLYESGACSNSELFRYYRDSLLDPWTRYTEFTGNNSHSHVYGSDQQMLVNIFGRMRYIEKIATNPRSLQSLCRLVISHHVGVGKPRRREKKIRGLPILSDKMKEYVLFADIVHPDFKGLPFNPDSLKSLCGLTVAARVGVGYPGDRDRVKELHLLSDKMKEFVLSMSSLELLRWEVAS